MAHQTVPALPTPRFPQQPYTGEMISSLDRLVARTIARAELRCCDFSDEHCDCREKATVHHLASEQEYCLDHFQEVDRG